MKTTTKIIVIIIATVAVYAISFAITAGLVKLVCWAFGFTFSWKLAIGVFAIMAIVSAAVKSNTTVKYESHKWW